jgi:hypothetical protein
MQDRRSRRSRRARFAGCGGTARPHTGHQSAGNPGPFAWLRPSAAPADWKIARLPSRKAQLAYPPRWGRYGPTRARFPRCCWDGTTASAATSTQRPSPAPRCSSTGPAFALPTTTKRATRRRSRRLGGRAAIRSGNGACVIDHCASTSARYKEIACIVRGTRATTVVVAAARPADRTRLAPPAPARGCELLELTQPRGTTSQSTYKSRVARSRPVGRRSPRASN